MNKTKTTLKASMEETIKLYRSWIFDQQKLIKYLDQLPNLGGYTGELVTGTDEAYHYDMPLDHAEVNKVKAAFVSAGWRVDADGLSPDYGWRKVVFYKTVDNIDKRFTVETEVRLKAFVYGMTKIEGATCRRVEIGKKKETKNVPIYEIVCIEGAEEMAVNNE